MNFVAIEKIKSLLLAFALVVLGVVCIVLPIDSFNVIKTVLGCLSIAFGIFMIIHYFVNIKEAPILTLLNGIIILGFGILTLVFQETFIWFVALALCFIGIQYIGMSIEFKRVGDTAWWKDFLYGIVQVILGIVLIILKAAVAETVIMISVGIMFILDGIFIFVMMFLLKHALRQIVRAAK